MQYLLAQYTEGLTNANEEALLFQLLEEEKENADWEPVIEELMAAEREQETYRRENWQPIVNSIVNGNRSENETGGKIRRLGNVYRYAASVIVLLGLAAAGYIYFNSRNNNNNNVPVRTAQQTSKDVIVPGGYRAMLTLADGSQIILDSAANGTLSQQGKTQIIKLDDGQLAYHAGAGTSEVLYNTISTPRGGQYQVILPDGSKVWLNAASSLRFPSTFSGTERMVEITGEGYFEVAKNAAMPFRVKTGEIQVEVLGTHFNVKAYADEESVNTTLLEGSVKVVSKAKAGALLKPGQQATLKDNETAFRLSDVDVYHEVAWKDGLFDFDNDNIQDIMRQLSRWYDVEVSYAGQKLQNHYTGSIRREVNISKVFEMLELAGGVQFSLDGKKVIIKGK